MKYSFFTTVDEIFHHEPMVRSHRDGSVVTEDRGWFIRFNGSYEALHVGTEKPEMGVGDRIKLTVEKIT